MVDFHSHVLPNMDDGAQSVEESLHMLHESARQGVTKLFATSHFYADSEDPESFLTRRDAAWERLSRAMADSGETLPELFLGAEVLYFPGMCEAEELSRLMIQGTRALLIEPPMVPWSDMMIDELEQTGRNLRCIPVVAHIDRYMRILEDDTLIDRLRGRKLLIQANASFFLRRSSVMKAMTFLTTGRIHFIGSDCHNLDTRSPNIGLAWERARKVGAGTEFDRLGSNAEILFVKK